MKNYILIAIILTAGVSTAYGQNFGNYPLSLVPLESTVNSESNDYAPCITPDKAIMYFTSYRSDGSFGDADGYAVKRSGSGWTQAVNLGEPFNSRKNDGAMAIAADGKTVVFSSERSGGEGDVDLYTAELSGGTLTNVKNMGPAINTKYWESQPTITGDGKTVYFVSNRSGGIGKGDIWMTTKNPDGTWSAPVGLDRKVNTKKDERSPYIMPDGSALFFSSKGHAGLGGYDIFVCTKQGNTWSNATNLGGIINSEKDELFFNAPAKGEQFFLSSSREGGLGELDIYAGTPNIFANGMFRLNISVIDSISGKPLPGVVTVFDQDAGEIALATIGADPETSVYTQSLPAGRRYRVEAKVTGYPSKTIYIANSPSGSQQEAKFLFGTIAFDFGNYQIPFFVTGYYRPNTSRSLDELFVKLDDDLSDATYIEDFEKGSKRYQQYQGYAKQVEDIFDRVTGAATDTIFPRFKQTAGPTEVLEIVVSGYADPQPILGKYVESETITFEDASGTPQSVKEGDRMTNLKLSGLRAWHSADYLKRLLEAAARKSGRTDYEELMKAGKIRWRYVGAGVSSNGDDYAAQRRIRVEFNRTGGSGRSNEFDMNKRK